jgi:hypothetical protein
MDLYMQKMLLSALLMNELLSPYEKMMDPNKMELGQTSSFLWLQHEEEVLVVHHRSVDEYEEAHACTPSEM